MNRFLVFFSILLIFGLTACKQDPGYIEDDPTEDTKPLLKVPRFNKDTAYAYVQKQVDFGPRVPNTDAHLACAKWLVDKFNSFNLKTSTQAFKATMYTGKVLNGQNIIASYNPNAKKRILLCAHWDTRFMGDQDKNPALKEKPILGADDGGSGVAVLLEIARVLSKEEINIGVDFVLFDAEDQGQSGAGPGGEESWCLGAQYWARNPHINGYKAEFGILLDMVGSKNARFAKEGTSMAFAPDVMNKVWNVGIGLGHGNHFDATLLQQSMTDDHLFVNKIAGIPTIDIINRPIGSAMGFGAYWHTHDDNMDIISKQTLRSVGNTVLHVIYKSAQNKF